jgi:RHS repeat-associated protein
LSNQVQSTDKSYVYNDHLGSVDVITNAVGTIRSNHSMSFDAWGSRRDGEDWSAKTAASIVSALVPSGFSRPIATRGYTGHEMVDDMGIIHMNGRIYDAKLGRFLQADPFIQAATDTQSYNRYSYVRNNPLNATDPSGFIFEKIGKELKRSHRNNIRSLVKVFGADVVNFAGNVASMGCGAWAAVCAANWSYDFAQKKL